MKSVLCPKDHLIPDEYIRFKNKCNEEGEDYSEVEAQCPTCGGLFETSQWGELKNVEDAKELLMEEIETYKQ